MDEDLALSTGEFIQMQSDHFAKSQQPETRRANKVLQVPTEVNSGNLDHSTIENAQM